MGDKEKCAVLRHLDTLILMHRLPGKMDVEKCKRAEPDANERSWRNVRDFCRNRITSLKT